MSTIYTDGAGNKYLGDCRWGTHDINYPSTNHLISSPMSSLSAGLFGLCTEAGLLFRNIATQQTISAEIGTGSSGDAIVPLYWGAVGDINDRFAFTINAYAPRLAIYHYNDNGSTSTSNLTDNAPLNSNKLYHIAHVIDGESSGGGNWRVPLVPPTISYKEVEWVGSSNGSYLSLLFYQNNLASSSASRGFIFAGELVDVNPTFSYYSATKISRSFSMVLASNYGNNIVATHYIAGSAKYALQTGRAIYNIDCADGQIPTQQWATDMWVYDNNGVLGSPVIGRVPNMLLGTGTYTYLKPVRIVGNFYPDGGSPWYLPVGIYAGKTLLMRCFSSM